MANITDSEMMLQALRKEREIVHERLMQIDRIIKRIRTGKLLNEESLGDAGIVVDAPQITNAIAPLNEFPKNADIKVQIIRVFELHRKAAKLKELQNIYNKLNETHYNIREPLRSLHRSRIVRMIREKDASRGIFWVKSEWIENEQLLDEFKPDGFDMLYKADNLEYE
ncbi:MAG: hypothetical protein JST87_14400 [Bacteroidetes bacterium]|nr:hypothetical protein [Bacteroidota bacterium]